jgi:hypothetical protein
VEAMKKGTMPLSMILVIIVILYFGWPGIRKWWKEAAQKSNTSQSALKPEPPQEQPVEADLPLDSKDAAVACGKVLKLDGPGFMKLNTIPRLSRLVSDGGFADEELKNMASAKDLEDMAFRSYALAYLTWEKPAQVSRASFDKMVIDAVGSMDKSKLSSAEQTGLDAFMVKFKRMMLRAFDLGRHDARISPCPS